MAGHLFVADRVGKDVERRVEAGGTGAIAVSRPSTDVSGRPVGEEICEIPREGRIAEVSYVWPRPGATTGAVPKVSFVTKVCDQVWAVGYYK